MSQASALQDLDAAIAETLADAGLADAATYTAPGGDPVTCTVVVDRNVEIVGGEELSDVVEFATVITIFRSEVDVPEMGGIVTLTAASEDFELARLHKRDESRTIWIAAE